jgi:hypothetical protein
MATEAARLKRKNPQQGGKRKTDRKRKTDLTLTGLLMEGVRLRGNKATAGQDCERRPLPPFFLPIVNTFTDFGIPAT